MGSEQGQAGMQRFTSDVADRIDRAGGYLEQTRGDELLADAERFVRSRPWVVTGAAVSLRVVRI